jgi:hypothetical protein
MRAALYLRVSTTDQTTAIQERELRAAAKRMGHTIVAVYATMALAAPWAATSGRPLTGIRHGDPRDTRIPTSPRPRRRGFFLVGHGWRR